MSYRVPQVGWSLVVVALCACLGTVKGQLAVEGIVGTVASGLANPRSVAMDANARIAVIVSSLSALLLPHFAAATAW
jgi:hypothetical protein